MNRLDNLVRLNTISRRDFAIIVIVCGVQKSQQKRKITMSEIVYIFTNPAMPDCVKIGKTSRDNVEQRLKELSNPTGVPMPFECPYAAEVEDAAKVEEALHKAFGCDRLNPKREFFLTEPQRIIDLLKAFAISDKTPLAQEVLGKITSPEDKSAQARVAAMSERRGILKFSTIDIEPGAELVFKRDDKKRCVVVDDRNVRYEGEEMLLVDLAVKLLHEMGIDTQSEDVRAPKEFTYNSELLYDRRVRLTSQPDQR